MLPVTLDASAVSFQLVWHACCLLVVLGASGHLDWLSNMDMDMWTSGLGLLNMAFEHAFFHVQGGDDVYGHGHVDIWIAHKVPKKIQMDT